MVRDNPMLALDDILARWHSWAKGFSVVPVAGADPMFRNAITSKGWDSTSDIIDDEINAKIMKAVDFQVGEMVEPYRTAIYINARNCYTGRSVWLSPRLPTDLAMRVLIVSDARGKLLKRLMSAGIL